MLSVFFIPALSRKVNCEEIFNEIPFTGRQKVRSKWKKVS